MKKYLIAIIFMNMLVSSCAPPMAVVAAPIATDTVYDDRTLTTIYQDEGITHQAFGLFKENKKLASSNLNVISVNNLVLIVGQVPNEDLKQQAYLEVNSIPEVKKVYNKVTIEKPTSTMVRSNDAWLTTKVKAAMLAENGLASSQIRVLTENSTVYLLGIVTKSEAESAVEVARKVKGVNKVVKLFQIKTEKLVTK